MSCYIHHVPGRLRIKNRSLKYGHKKCLAAQAVLSLIEGVEEVRSNPAVGSITVTYDREVTSGRLLMQALEERNLIGRPAMQDDVFLARTLADAGEIIGRELVVLVVKQALQANGLSLLAALI